MALGLQLGDLSKLFITLIVLKKEEVEMWPLITITVTFIKALF